LRDERRHDHQPDDHDDADDGQVDDEDGEPSRDGGQAAAGTGSLDHVDQRREAHRDQRADVDEHQGLARQPRRWQPEG